MPTKATNGEIGRQVCLSCALDLHDRAREQAETDDSPAQTNPKGYIWEDLACSGENSPEPELTDEEHRKRLQLNRRNVEKMVRKYNRVHEERRMANGTGCWQRFKRKAWGRGKP